MPTFFETYQEYLKDPRAIKLGNKKYKALHGRIKNYYDKWEHRSPVQYKAVEYDGALINVRDYPANFVPRMQYLIISFCEKLKFNMANDARLLAEKKARRQAGPPKNPAVKEKRQRTRKPVQKPAYTTKK